MKKKLFSAFVVLISVSIIPRFVYAQSLGDPFDGNSFKNGNWEWQSEPPEWDMGETNEGWLHIVPQLNQNLWASDTSTRLYQETNEDPFEVETHIVIDYQGECVVGGLVAYSPVEDNWTTIKFWGRAADAVIQWQHKAQEVVGNVPGSSQPAGRVEAYLRLRKDGDNFLGWWKKTEDEDWIEIKPDAPLALTPPIQIGVFGGICAAAGQATIEYEYFKDLINPFAVKPVNKLSTTWSHIRMDYN